MTLLLRAKDGGYDPDLGFVADGRKPVETLPPAIPTSDEAYRKDCRSSQPKPIDGSLTIWPTSPAPPKCFVTG